MQVVGVKVGEINGQQLWLRSIL